jgi:hypothetical protein
MFDALVATLCDTRLEPDIESLLWSTTNLFHRAASRILKELDDNEQAQRRSQREQDGSEVKSTDLERLTAEGQTLIERRNAFELMRDVASDQFEIVTGSAWRPRSGSMVNHKAMTSAMIDSRDFLNARKHAETTVHLPTGPKIVVTGGLDFHDHTLIWAKLDQALAKHSATWCCCMADRQRAQSSLPQDGQTIEKSRRSPSSPTGPNTARLRPSGAMTSYSPSCRSACWSFPAPASRTIWPTRRASSAFRSGGTGDAARAPLADYMARSQM